MPAEFDDTAFQVDHVIAVSHGGATHFSNLCLACFACNTFKGPNLSGRDPETHKTVQLFNPRKHKWHHHFLWNDARLAGRTATGRATIATLRINLDHRIAHRLVLMDEGAFPSD
jgi:hypothetical protein